jgi:hypothetical protein
VNLINFRNEILFAYFGLAAEVRHLPTNNITHFNVATSQHQQNLVLFDNCSNAEDQARQSQQDHGSEEGQGHEGSWQEIRSV